MIITIDKLLCKLELFYDAQVIALFARLGEK